MSTIPLLFLCIVVRSDVRNGNVATGRIDVHTANPNNYTINENYLIHPSINNDTRTNSHSKRKIRKELRDLTGEELAEYKNAVNMLRDHGIIDDLALLHTACETYAHNSTRFLPWHRAFLLYFEHIIKTVTNKTISVPYWDWSMDAYTPTQSYALQHVWPINDTNHCFRVNFPFTHCVKRSTFIDAFYGTAQIKRMLKLPFSKFCTSFEIVPHAIVHLNVGGKDGDMAMLYSCNDPIFFHHHSYIDYVWSVQQVKGGNWYHGDFDEMLFPFEMRVRDVWKSAVEYKPYAIDYMNGGDGKKSERTGSIGDGANNHGDDNRSGKDKDNEIGRKGAGLSSKNGNNKTGNIHGSKSGDSRINDYKPIGTNYRHGITRIPDFYIKRHKYSKRRTRLTERYLNDAMSLLDRILF
ncbi:hypothetical protein VCUG_02184 [Vavraia culicis subsp. floridensis]|uniref:Tyrosinase copper-binding domain-containing protein n=1 Tax=Vavraia culicis (isolate floridensis) TaxID=948595 RepID=L2GRS8_VAVCU|nr:uncharacterized protein VCUG_02184 [Vavraia culicis subsp. floridensis]ELA46339.1 hypothetical protein VCUG_02184 [Vavraia culicis subsp. floridensis]